MTGKQEMEGGRAEKPRVTDTAGERRRWGGGWGVVLFALICAVNQAVGKKKQKKTTPFSQKEF